MMERARTYEYPYPYLQDLPQSTARVGGVQVRTGMVDRGETR
jgi:hypothetical protein